MSKLYLVISCMALCLSIFLLVASISRIAQQDGGVRVRDRKPEEPKENLDVQENFWNGRTLVSSDGFSAVSWEGREKVGFNPDGSPIVIEDMGTRVSKILASAKK